VQTRAGARRADGRSVLGGFGRTVAFLGIAVAIVVLELRPPGKLGLFVSIPAALLLLGVSGRLFLALHDARRTSEALTRSHTDDVTGLPNRRGLRERVDASIARGAGLGIAVLDLDGFKDINDTLGHLAGDAVLERVGHRIRRAVPALATVARLGGDEFGILAPRGDIALMVTTANEVLDVLSEPLRVEGIDIVLAASVGIVEWVGDEPIDSTELLRRAEVAMYRGKGGTRSSVVIYDPLHDDYSKARLRISDELRRGIANGELEVWYQPQIDASTMRPCALEALVRWRHPTNGLLSPVAFLPAARRAGLMPLLSQEVVRLAVADIARWHASGLRLRVAVNCSPPELLSGVFVPRLHEAVAAAGLPPGSLVLEVTEESFMGEPERARELMQDVRDYGVQIAIDDYGTGFSSLAYLRDLPVDELKLDRSFVSAVGTDERSRMIVASTVQMARALGLRTVAEGVEDAATAAELIAMGVTALQGYHISRPMRAADVAHWVTQWPIFADVVLSGERAVSPRVPARQVKQ
jgi:diguanylate cyclase (GGDEF)-like protein